MKEENVWGRKLEEMIHVHVEVEKNINCVASIRCRRKKYKHCI